MPRFGVNTAFSADRGPRIKKCSLREERAYQRRAVSQTLHLRVLVNIPPGNLAYAQRTNTVEVRLRRYPTGLPPYAALATYSSDIDTISDISACVKREGEKA